MTSHAPDTLPRPGHWADHAACIGIDPAVMDPDERDGRAVERARGICGACPVARACLVAALREEGSDAPTDRWGVRGGVTPTGRRALYLKHNPASRSGTPLQPCGTRAAYRRHRERGETPCEGCQQAAADAQQRQRQRDRARRAAQRATAASA